MNNIEEIHDNILNDAIIELGMGSNNINHDFNELLFH
jgi:hypothetical protein